MEYLDFLKGLHEAVRPRAYLEIGLRHGDSLALADCPALGVDPAFNLRVELGENVELLRETSDEYFGRPKPLKPLGGRKPDMAFIDGMHLAEFALRDFIGVERLSPWTGVIVFDDILPRTVEEANRDRRTRAWTGDVYKVLGILARHRPDLICLRVGTQPTGLLLVLGARPVQPRALAAPGHAARADGRAGPAGRAGRRDRAPRGARARGGARLARVARAARPARPGDDAPRRVRDLRRAAHKRPRARQPQRAATALARLSVAIAGHGSRR